MDLEPLDQTELPRNEPQAPVPLGKVVGINFGIMLLYMALTALSSTSGSEKALESLIFDAMLLVLQVSLNIIGGVILLFTDKKQLGRAMLLSGLIIGIIGFGACVGKASLFE